MAIATSFGIGRSLFVNLPSFQTVRGARTTGSGMAAFFLARGETVGDIGQRIRKRAQLLFGERDLHGRDRRTGIFRRRADFEPQPAFVVVEYSGRESEHRPDFQLALLVFIPIVEIRHVAFRAGFSPRRLPSAPVPWGRACPLRPGSTPARGVR